MSRLHRSKPHARRNKPATQTRAPLFSSPVAAGFPVPAGDGVERHLSLDTLIIDNPVATFFVRAEGDSMVGSGIVSGSILVVDRSRVATNGSIVVAAVNGDLVVKRIIKRGKNVYLSSDNPHFKPIHLTSDTECVVWGVVCASVIRFNT